ncbi:MAG TPA: hypothetical protein PK874_13795 [Desulfobacteraceae bacterium]|nr:hypothetical protein [Desulfobacteraceae bacterium]
MEQKTATTFEDLVLQGFVDTINREEKHVSLTFTIGGAILTGQVVCEKEYYKFIKAEKLYDTIEEIRKEYEEREKSTPHLPKFMHVQNLRIIAGAFGGRNINLDKVIWRFKISAVEGYALYAEVKS